MSGSGAGEVSFVGGNLHHIVPVAPDQTKTFVLARSNDRCGEKQYSGLTNLPGGRPRPAAEREGSFTGSRRQIALKSVDIDTVLH
ncbi:hypothetical protein ACFFV8_07095 [Sphingobium indicum]|uniref:hypothetical protein n=1 Tax=Sphingobium TaxID=165695 RepID=UPI000F65F4E5|nr:MULTISPECIES: hypothetical protein [Sphingobium]